MYLRARIHMHDKDYNNNNSGNESDRKFLFLATKNLLLDGDF